MSSASPENGLAPRWWVTGWKVWVMPAWARGWAVARLAERVAGVPDDFVELMTAALGIE